MGNNSVFVPCTIYPNTQDQELLQIADSAWDEAWSVANSQEGWKEVKRNELGDIVKMKKNKKGETIGRTAKERKKGTTCYPR